MTYNSVSVTVEEEVALVFVDRPEKLNALNRETIKELGEALGVLEEDPQVRAIILTGSGPKAFVAGADIAEFSEFTYQSVEFFHYRINKYLISITQLDQKRRVSNPGYLNFVGRIIKKIHIRNNRKFCRIIALGSVNISSWIRKKCIFPNALLMGLAKF